MMRWNEHFLEPSFGGVCKMLLQSIGFLSVGIKVFLFVLLFRQKDENHLPKRWLAHSLKTQEILAKRWTLLRTSPNGLWAVFAGFLSVFKFTGSTAPRLGGLTRCVDVA
jgi:hypothetical protein